MTIAFDGESGYGRGVLVLAWGAVLVAAMVWGIANERLDMSGRAAEALAGANVPAAVRVEGRDVIVGGVSPADQAHVVAVLESVPGVREVVSTDTGPAAAPPVTVATTARDTPRPSPPTPRPAPRPAVAEQVARPAYVSARLESGAITIEGVVPSEAAATRIAEVADLIYAPFVTNALEVDASAGSAPWIHTVADGIAVLPLVGTAHLTPRRSQRPDHRLCCHREPRGPACRCGARGAWPRSGGPTPDRHHRTRVPELCGA